MRIGTRVCIPAVEAWDRANPLVLTAVSLCFLLLYRPLRLRSLCLYPCENARKICVDAICPQKAPLCVRDPICYPPFTNTFLYILIHPHIRILIQHDMLHCFSTFSKLLIDLRDRCVLVTYPDLAFQVCYPYL